MFAKHDRYIFLLRVPQGTQSPHHSEAAYSNSNDIIAKQTDRRFRLAVLPVKAGALTQARCFTELAEQNLFFYLPVSLIFKITY